MKGSGLGGAIGDGDDVRNRREPRGLRGPRGFFGASWALRGWACTFASVFSACLARTGMIARKGAGQERSQRADHRPWRPTACGKSRVTRLTKRALSTALWARLQPSKASTPVRTPEPAGFVRHLVLPARWSRSSQPSVIADTFIFVAPAPVCNVSAHGYSSYHCCGALFQLPGSGFAVFQQWTKLKMSSWWSMFMYL